jgi:hypothetical protein
MRYCLALALLCLATLPALADELRSIVGNWRFAQESCALPIRIGPKSLTSEDVSCRFTSVVRNGRTVTWTGVCEDAEGSANETVVATERNGRLTIRYLKGGNVLADLVRCE